jgi:hypothetical protein
MFILIREGFAAWLTADGAAAFPKICTRAVQEKETNHDELACLLASIILERRQDKNGL